LTPYQQKKIDKFFSVQKVGDKIYAGYLKSIIFVDIKVAYNILEELKNQKFLRNVYEVYCTNCSKSKGIFLNSINEFTEDMYCEFCNKQLCNNEPMSPLDNLIVLYEVTFT
jgi:hypothetical protein